MPEAHITHLPTPTQSPSSQDASPSLQHLRSVIVQEYIDKLPTQLTVPGVAYLLGTTRDEVERLITKGEIIARGSGYARYVRPSDNRTFLLSRSMLRMLSSRETRDRIHHIDLGIDLADPVYERLFDYAVNSDLSLPAAVSSLLTKSLS